MTDAYSRRWKDRAIVFFVITCVYAAACGGVLAGYGLGVILGRALT